jgi:hypothetical protein
VLRKRRVRLGPSDRRPSTDATAASARGRLTAVAVAVAVAATLAGCSAKQDAAPPTTTGTTQPPETTTTTEAPLTAGRQVYVWTPQAGECFDKRKPDPKKPDEVVLLLDCNLPHSYEVVGTVEVPGPVFPGELAMTEQGKKACPKQFKEYVGAPYETSKWELGYYLPSASSWGQSSRHLIACYLRDPNPARKLEGAKKGSNQ